MTILRTIPGSAKIYDFESVLNERREDDRVEQAEIAASWFFDLVTKSQKAEFNAVMQSLIGMTGPKWDRARDAARAKWRDDTKEARALFDASVEQFLSTGELSGELDAKWTELCERAVAAAMADAAE